MKNSSDSSVQEIKRRLSIVEVIQNFVSLKKSGKNYLGICPFHDDHNPSMHVNEADGVFYCFSCGAGGDMFTFLMKYGNMGFREALKELASKAGVRLPASPGKTKGGGKENAASAKLFEINSFVRSLYGKTLLNGKKDSAAARAYLEGRGITSEIIKEFGLGFAPDSWNTVLNFARREKIKIEELLKLGLVISREEQNKYYDRFRNRIIFPICEIDGRVCGFGGRIMAEAGQNQPKYLNSPESPIFSKKSVLYGLYHSKNEIRRKRKAVLVEGYMDFLKLYINGIRNVVATLGTAFTKNHATILRRFCEEVTIVYDGDEAGINSAVRAGKILLEQGMSPGICRIPDQLDPDDYLDRYGSQNLTELIADATFVADFIIDDTYVKYRDKKKTSGESIESLADMVSKINNPVERAEAVSKVSGVFGIRESEFLSLIKNSNSGKNRGSLAPKIPTAEENIYERDVIRILLKFPDLIDVAKVENVGEYFEKGDFKTILDRMIDGEFADVSLLMSSFEEVKMQQLLSELIFSSEDLIDKTTSEKILVCCLKGLKLRDLAFRRSEVMERIRKQNDNSDKSGERELVEQYRDIVNMEKAVRGTVS